MRPLRLDLCGSWSRHLLAGLTVLLAAAVLSLVLFPAVHGSFVSPHGPATAFRSRRLLPAICLWMGAIVELLADLFCAIKPELRVRVHSCGRAPVAGLAARVSLCAVLLC